VQHPVFPFVSLVSYHRSNPHNLKTAVIILGFHT
jgi:hypothetical protein